MSSAESWVWQLGFDIGGTKCAVLLGRVFASQAEPEIVAREAFATRDYPGPDAALTKMLKLAKAMISREGLSLTDIVSAGVSCGGPLDSKRGVVLSPPNLPGWDEVPVVAILSEAFQVPVRLQNDANACALAEHQWGAARGADTAVFLTCGTGMGAGLIIDGRLFDGRNGPAGEIGHWRLAPDGPVGFGKAGSFEGFCSGGGMARLAKMEMESMQERGEAIPAVLLDAEFVDVKLLAGLAREGDPLAKKIFTVAGEKLGQALALIVDMLNPDVVVIGSIFTRCEDLLRAPMEQALAAEAIPASLGSCRILPAELGDEIGDYAALAVGSLR